MLQQLSSSGSSDLLTNKLKRLREGQSFTYHSRTFIKLELIPTNRYTAVLKCFEEKTREYYIVKVFRINNLDENSSIDNDENDKETAMGEINHASECDSMHNLNVLTYEIAETTQDGKEAIIISPYRGLHLEMFRKSMTSVLCIAVVFQVIYELLAAVRSVHRRGLIHRDIKPHNVFVLENILQNIGISIPSLLTITLGDFGTACKKEELIERYGSIVVSSSSIDQELYDDDSDDISCSSSSETEFTKDGTVGYIAPECYDGIFDERNDIWSVGSTILTFLFPNRNTNQDTKEKVMQVVDTVDELFGQQMPIEFENDPNAWKVIAELLKGMLNNNPNERLTIDGVLDVICKGKQKLKVATLSTNYYECFREELINNKSIALLCASVGVPVLRPTKIRPIVSDELKKDKSIALQVIKKNGLEFQNVHESLKSDKELVLLSIRSTSNGLQFAAESLKCDFDFVLQVVSKNGYCLQYAHEDLRKDYRIVMAAVKNSGFALCDADEKFRKDRSIVMEAVKNDGLALEHADDSLKKDREIVKAAVEQEESALQFADESLQQDEELLQIAATPKVYNFEEEADPQPVAVNTTIVPQPKTQRELLIYDLPNAHPTLKKDKLFILEANRLTNTALKYADESLKKDEAFILSAIQDNYRAFEYVDDSFKKDRQFVMRAVLRHGYALKYADETFRKDKQIVLLSVSNRGQGIEFADPELRKDPEIVLAAVRKRGNSLEYADDILKNDIFIVTEAVKNYTPSFMYASPELRKDKQFVKELMKLNKNVLDFADKSIRNDPDLVEFQKNYDSKMNNI